MSLCPDSVSLSQMNVVETVRFRNVQTAVTLMTSTAYPVIHVSYL